MNELLDSSKVWSAYKDQKHDLFITDTPIAGYLTAGSVGGVAGYLTAGTSIGSGGTGAPPPLEPPEDVGANEDD